MKQEAKHFHADGDEEEDKRVPPLILYQQLGEDASQGDDYPGCTWEGSRKNTRHEKMEKVRKTVKQMRKIAEIEMCMCVWLYSLSPVITPCVYLLGSIPM